MVDKFVLLEATRTFSNQPKPLYYQENRGRFAKFADKIIHVVVNDSPDTSDAWEVQRVQRNCIARGLTHCRPDDWVLVSDLDEIPRATAVENVTREIPIHDNFFSNCLHSALNSRAVKSVFHRRGFRRRLRHNHPFVWKYEQTLHRYFLNCVSTKPAFWHGTRMMRFRDFSCAEEMRYSGYKIVRDGGWHFTWMGGVERILKKVQSISAHREINRPQFTDPDRIKKLIESGRYVFGDSPKLKFVPIDETFPHYVLEHPEVFSSWIRPVENDPGRA